ncbi:hypothetical protein M413DRAFT_185794 [Hebeloma cylindrosporum]|uniref:Uncharacterized protein n=1 Tax=Hebeloma cylindrosporum TaxID=76867 RepID=A0A0C3C8D8_HEBCY|nr:hypothetical protein M413DRAFT_185794 [Hebeloma cylindrosporum h7]
MAAKIRSALGHTRERWDLPFTKGLPLLNPHSLTQVPESSFFCFADRLRSKITDTQPFSCYPQGKPRDDCFLSLIPMCII